MNSFTTLNLDFIEEQYARWTADPASVPPDWRFFFEGFDLAASGRLPAAGTADADQVLRTRSVAANFSPTGSSASMSS